MTKVIDKDFWEKEDKMLWKLVEKLQEEVKKNKTPLWVESKLMGEYPILSRFFISKISEDTPEMKLELESKANGLGYSATRGIQAWFAERKKELKKEFHQDMTQRLPRRDKKIKETEEAACVKRFFKNRGQSLEESQLITPAEDSPVDVTVELHFQVTNLERERVGRLSQGDIVLGTSPSPEGIRREILEVIEDKEPKSRPYIILLLNLRPLLYDEEEEKILERAVAELQINSSFKEIHIVTPRRNIPIKT